MNDHRAKDRTNSNPTRRRQASTKLPRRRAIFSTCFPRRPPPILLSSAVQPLALSERRVKRRVIPIVSSSKLLEVSPAKINA